jgi:phosphotriesterase-related protein
VWWEGPGDWRVLDERGVNPEPADVARRPQAVNRENLVLSDWYLAAKELRAARDSGCQLLVDLTVDGLRPNVRQVAEAARLAGLPIVFSVGRYLAGTLDAQETLRSAEELAGCWVHRIRDGFEGIVPGVIGEIGTGAELAPAERISLQAAALAQQETGLPINVHVHPYARRALQVLEILTQAGADLSRVAVSHCDGELDLPWLASVLRTGCFVEMDQFGTGPNRLIEGRGYPSDEQRVAAIVALCEAGFSDRLLLSHDICMRSSLQRFGGWGYGHLGSTVRPRLVSALGEHASQQLLADNPLRFLAVTDDLLEA